jgi:tetratricopeptide (TPR) repeat protein
MPTASAALMTLGAAAPRAVEHCDEVWRAQNLANWRKRHNQIKEAHWKLSEYSQYEDSALPADDLWAKAGLLLNVHREEEAIDSLRQLVSRQGKYPDAHLLLARLLLKYGEEEGLQHLLQATQQRSHLADSAAEIGYDYLVSRGRKTEAMRFAQRVQALLDA